jgi:transcriptional regulator with XRE-family HTH domain
LLLQLNITQLKNKDLAKRVKELRKRNSMSQELLAENSGLSLRTVQRIENGETQPTGDSIKRLSSALNVTPNELIDWQIIEDSKALLLLNLS